jgi:hypothetical protein
MKVSNEDAEINNGPFDMNRESIHTKSSMGNPNPRSETVYLHDFKAKR